MFITRRNAFLSLAAIVLAFGNTCSSNAAAILNYTILGTTPVHGLTNSNTTPWVSTANSPGTGSTSFTTSGDGSGGAIAVSISMPGIIISNTYANPLAGYMLFNNFVSHGAAGYSYGAYQQYFSGSIMFNSKADGTGINYLTATFTDSLFGGQGTTANVSGGTPTVGTPTRSLTYTSDIIQHIATATLPGFSLTLNNINPPLSSVGAGSTLTVGSFVANGTGQFDASVDPANNSTPEPSTLAGAGLAVAVAIGFFRRRRSAQVA